jgi:hypothetical protein
LAEREAPEIDPTLNIRINKGEAVKDDRTKLRELHFIDGGDEPRKAAPVAGDPNCKIRDAIQEFMDQNPGIQPNFSRGAEQELDTIRDMENMRANMVNMKIHVDANTIKKAFLFSKDVSVNETGFPHVVSTLMQTSVPPVEKATIVKKAKKKKTVMK